MKEEERDFIKLIGNLFMDTPVISSAHDTVQQTKQTGNAAINLIHLDSERFLKTIMETTQDGFILVEGDGNIIYANESYFNMTGYDKDDLKTLNIRDLTQSNQGELEHRLQIIMDKGTSLFETVDKRKDGSFYNVEVSATCLCKEPRLIVCFMRDITGRKNAEKSIIHSHDLMRYIIEHSRSAVAVHDKDLKYMYVSRPYIENFRVKDENPIGKNHYDVFPNLSADLKKVHQRVLKGEIITRDEDTFIYEDGTMDWVRWECRPWFDNDGEIGGFVLYSEIITERKQMEQMLYNEKEHFRTILLSVGEGVISTDKDGIITVMNPIAEKLTGWTAKKALGEPLENILTLVHEDPGMPFENYIQTILQAEKIVELSNGLLLISKVGYEIPVEISASPIKDSSGHIAGVVIIIRDFTEKRIKQGQIEYLSYHDHLTGLYNRRFMEDSIKRLDTKRNLPLTLMVIDVNGLKLTNDAFGHETGDQLLKEVSEILKKVCRSDDIIGRLGGDELCILLPHTDEHHAERIKQRIKTAASNLKLDPVIVSLAVGYATKTSPDLDIKIVMTTADNMMYKDKIKYGKEMRSQTIEMVLHHINSNYEQEQIHTEKVSQYCEAIAKAMNFSKKEIHAIKNAAALHDIGKIMVPPHILNKPGRLSQEEFGIIKRHPEIGYQMLKSVDEYVMLAEYVLHHHERWDGTGYPEGLVGEDIPLYSRIIAVADAFEAMTAVRPYQKTKTKDEAIAELVRCAGVQFDPDVVQVFIEKLMS